MLRAAASGHAPWGGRQCGWRRVRLQLTRRGQGAQCARRRRNRQRLRLLGLLLRERRLRSSRRADADVGLGLGVCRRADGSELLLPGLNFYQLPSRSCQSQTTGRTQHQQCSTGLHAGEHTQATRGGPTCLHLISRAGAAVRRQRGKNEERHGPHDCRQHQQPQKPPLHPAGAAAGLRGMSGW